MRVVTDAGILFIIAYMVYFAKVGNRPPTLLRKIIALYAFNTAVVEVLFGAPSATCSPGIAPDL